MPPQLLEYFKNKNKKKEDGKEMSDKEKRKEALDKSKMMKNKKKIRKISKKPSYIIKTSPMNK